ncbi:MAG TPA: hypothetical protein VMZ90_06060 [Vicinamibacterales bacterium]|nr:hypothetical protein [Vicinamibacterales bacterium]
MRMLIATALLLLVAQSASGQAPATSMPRTADGHPDFSGIWQTMNSAAWNVEDHSATLGVPAGQGVVEGGTIPYLPAALTKRNENFTNRATADPETKCYLLGVPRIMYAGFPFQIIQSRAQVTVLYEWAHATRYIYTNGTPHPPGHIDWWMGDSRGRWEGDTLVVDVVHFGGETWLDRAGNYHSDALHVVERFTPLDADHITYDVRIEDPKVFARPWTMSMILYRHREKNFQLLEYECYGFDAEKYYPYPELNR